MRFADLTLAFLLSNNLLFSHFLGLSEMLGPISFQQIFRRSLMLGALLMFCGGLYWGLSFLVLKPFHLAFLTTIAAVLCLVIGNLTYSWIRTAFRREGAWPEPKEVLFHTVVFGGLLLANSASSDGLEFLVISAAAILGYGLGMVFLNAVFLRMSRERIPVLFQGLPFQLFTAGLVWLILSGLDFQFVGTAG